MSSQQYPDKCPRCGGRLTYHWIDGEDFEECDTCDYPFGLCGDDDEDFDEGEYEWDTGLYEEPDYDQDNENRNPNDSRNL